MDKHTIILISGKKQSGKDTGADYLCHSFNFKKVSFASNVKEQCHKLVNILWDNKIDINYFYDEVLKETSLVISGINTPITARQIMQEYGTDFMRGFDENYWVNKIVEQFRKEQANYVISDFRFPNECAILKRDLRSIYDIYTLRVNRPSLTIVDEHESETALDDYIGWNYIINNDGTKEDLFKELDVINYRLEEYDKNN